MVDMVGLERANVGCGRPTASRGRPTASRPHSLLAGASFLEITPQLHRGACPHRGVGVKPGGVGRPGLTHNRRGALPRGRVSPVARWGRVGSTGGWRFARVFRAPLMPSPPGAMCIPPLPSLSTPSQLQPCTPFTGMEFGNPGVVGDRWKPIRALAVQPSVDPLHCSVDGFLVDTARASLRTFAGGWGIDSLLCHFRSL